MTIEQWLDNAIADVKARDLVESVPVLEALARVMHVLREAPWNDDALSQDTRGQAAS